MKQWHFVINVAFCYSKGKKDGKHESKPDKETEMDKAKANAAVWELRLKVTEESLAQYRESYHRLARANGQLTEQLYRAEKDSIDISGFFKRRDDAKEETVRAAPACVCVMKSALNCGFLFADQYAAQQPQKSRGTRT